MRAICFFLSLVVLVGCATRPSPSLIAPRPVESSVPKPASSANSVLTRYDLGTYRYPKGEQQNRERAVYRSTRVTLRRLASEDGRAPDYGIPSFDPLPPSVELAVELETQRKITVQIRRARDAMAELERQARNQYAALVTHTEETARLSQHLETERARLRELETRLQEKMHAVSAPPAGTQSTTPVSTPNQEIKW